MPLYVPRHNREDDREALHAFVRAHPFATLVSAGAGGPEATHLPLLFDAERGPNGTLVGHMARANDHWKHLERHPDVLVIFHGPDAFVSAAWYAPPTAISTWNYAVVHARGAARIVHDAGWLHEAVERLRALYDAPETQAMPYDEQKLRAIVGVEIEVTRLDGKFKLSQNRSDADQAQVRAHLAAGDAGAQRVAAMMTDAVRRTKKGAQP